MKKYKIQLNARAYRDLEKYLNISQMISNLQNMPKGKRIGYGNHLKH